MTQGEQMIHLSPTAEIQKSIKPHNKSQLRSLGAFLFEMSDGVDTVGYGLRLDFVIGYRAVGKRGDGLRHHCEPVMGRCKGGGWFVWRISRRNENYAIELNRVVDILGNMQMPIMDGIE